MSETTCYRHSSIETGLSCMDCGRPICGRCVVTGAVGQVCPECSKSRGRQVMVDGRAVFGKVLTLGPTRATTALMIVIAVASIAVFTPSGAPLWDAALRNGLLLADGEWWRSISLVLVHVGGIIHLALNLWGMWLLGPRVEARFGSVSFVVLFLAAAAGGSVAYGLLGDPWAGAGGASGAVFGLLGATLAEGLEQRGTARGSVILGQVRGWLIISVIVPFVMPIISWQDHLGGFVVGFALAWLWGRNPSWNAVMRLVLGIPTVLVLVLASVAVAGGGGVG